MAITLPEDLKEKLKMIETETNLRSHRVLHPSRSLLAGPVLGLVLCVLLMVRGRPQNTYFVMFWLVISVVNILGYFEQRKASRLYDSAVEIIDFYKEQTRKGQSPNHGVQPTQTTRG